MMQVIHDPARKSSPSARRQSGQPEVRGLAAPPATARPAPRAMPRSASGARHPTAARRLAWMDFARGLCVALVVFYHAAVYFHQRGLPVPDAFNTLNLFMEPFRIPLLMFLSGMLLHKSLSKQAAPYFKGKFNLIYWPFLVWSPIIYFFEGKLTLEYVLETPITAPSGLWYLWFLTAFYGLAYFIHRWRLPILPIIVVSLVASEFLPSILRMDRFAALLVMFLGGHLVAQHLDRFSGQRLAGLIGLAIAVGGGIWSVTVAPIKYDPVFCVVPLGLIAFILVFARHYATTVLTLPVEWIGRNSIVFYVAHFPVVLFVADRLQHSSGLDPAAMYLGTFAAAMLVGMLLQALRSRTRVVAAFFDFRVLLRLGLSIARYPIPSHSFENPRRTPQ